MGKKLLVGKTNHQMGNKKKLKWEKKSPDGKQKNHHMEKRISRCETNDSPDEKQKNHQMSINNLQMA